MEPVSRIGNAIVGAGMGGTMLFGLWLAFAVGGYELWDGWIVAALVLWVISAPLGRRTGEAYTRGAEKARELERAGETAPSTELLALNRTSSGVVLHGLWSLVTLLILVDMIWKPGA